MTHLYIYADGESLDGRMASYGGFYFLIIMKKSGYEVNGLVSVWLSMNYLMYAWVTHLSSAAGLGFTAKVRKLSRL